MPAPEFDKVFGQLKDILKPYAERLTVVADSDQDYWLDTNHTLKNGKKLFFGAVRRGKAYVSFYLMPLYAQPDLVAGISPQLKNRMQGKSCFNFRTADEALFRELKALTKKGFTRFKAAKYIE